MRRCADMGFANGTGRRRRSARAGGLWLVLWVFGSCAAAAGTLNPATNEISLDAKSHFRIALERPISRVAIGNPDIFEAKVTTSRELVLVGKTPGNSGLIVWMQGDGPPKEFSVTVTVDSSGLQKAYNADPELAHITVGGGKSIVLKGNVRTAEEHQRAMRLARGYSEHIVDEIKVLQQQMVSVEVRFAAMSVSSLQKLGFDFSVFGRGLQVATTGPNSVSDFSFTPSTGLDLSAGLPIRDAFNLFLASPHVDFLSVLSVLSGTRLAQVLAEPTLIVRSGESAEFIAGGEIPIPVPQQQGAIGIEYRNFGIQLKLAATVLSPDRIALRISPEVSDLDFAHGVTIGGTQVPAITTRGTTTTVELGDGQSFVLAGLMSSSQSDSEQKVPFVGDIPILGSFFKRVDNSRERQELVIVATPRLVQPVNKSQLPPPPGFDMQKYDPSFGDLLLNTDPLDRRVLRYGLMP